MSTFCAHTLTFGHDILERALPGRAEGRDIHMRTNCYIWRSVLALGSKIFVIYVLWLFFVLSH